MRSDYYTAGKEAPMNPKISVCIPAYNAAEFISRAITSVLTQTFSEFELIIIDDKSFDDTGKIVSSFNDERIRYILNEKTVGPAANFNKCIASAQTDYIYLFHADDIMLPENLAIKFRTLEKYIHVGMIYSNAYIIDENDKVLKKYTEKQYRDISIKPGLAYVRRLLAGLNTICAPSVMVRKKYYSLVGGYDERLTHMCDWEMWARISAYCRVAYVPIPLIMYRKHTGAHSNDFAGGLKQLEEYFNAQIFYIDKVFKQARKTRLLRHMTLIEYVLCASGGCVRALYSGKIYAAKKYLIFLFRIIWEIAKGVKESLWGIRYLLCCLWVKITKRNFKLYKYIYLTTHLNIRNDDFKAVTDSTYLQSRETLIRL